MTVSAKYTRLPLHLAAGADANGAELEVQVADGAYVAGAFQISGTVTTAVIYFEATVDGTNWVALECSSLGASITVATSATATGVWRFNALGLRKVRARLDWTAGSVTVWGSLVA
jgi:hypothetical protein